MTELSLKFTETVNGLVARLSVTAKAYTRDEAFCIEWNDPTIKALDLIKINNVIKK